MAGVFNGLSNYTPSHRARLPSIHNVFVSTESPGNVQFVEQALHVRDGVWSNRTAINTESCSAIIEQRMYCHRVRRNVMVLEFQAFPAALQLQGCAVTVQLEHRDNISAFGTADIVFNSFESNETTITLSGVTRTPELYGSLPTSIAMSFDKVPQKLSLITGGPTQRFLAAAHSDLEEGVNVRRLAAGASRTLAAANVDADSLLEEHISGWQRIWESGIEVEGNMSVAKAVNASLYYIRSAIRADFAHGISPGGLAIDSYDGRSFWDSETWMFPIIDIFDESLGESMLRYRLARLPAAIERASQYGVDGAMFPWTSTQSGFDTTHQPINSTCSGNLNCTGLGWQEQHITGDIALAFRLHWWTTHNISFLQESWELINATAAFWASRFVRHPGNGNWTVLGVVGPDEPSGVHDSECYTNAVGSQTILFAAEVANLLNLSALPADWTHMAASPYLPVSTSLAGAGGAAVHVEYEGYQGGASDCCETATTKDSHNKTGCCIMQSAVALLQYPLGLPLSATEKRNDLKYYEPRTQQNGFFTGDSIYSIAWLALGNANAALKQWNAAFQHMDCANFCVFRERLSGGHSNFITGSGGFLQNIVQGWAGVRVTSDAMIIRSPRLPPTVSSVKLRSLQFRGNSFHIKYDSQSVQFTAARPSPLGTQLTVSRSNGSQHRVGSVPVTFHLLGDEILTVKVLLK